MSLKFKISCFVFLFIFQFSCSNEDAGDIVFDVDREFVLDLKEVLHPEKNNLQLSIRTISSDYCPGSEIVIKESSNLSAMNIHLDIQEISSVEECDLKDQPALKDVNLGALSLGTYEVRINLANTVPNEGKLIVGAQSYTLVLDATNGIVSGQTSLKRIPRNAVWVSITREDNAAAFQTEEALIKQMEENHQKKVLSDGYYGHFEIHAGHVEFPVTNTLEATTRLAFELEGSLEYFEEQMKAFQQMDEHKDLFENENIKVVFYAANGEVF